VVAVVAAQTLVLASIPSPTSPIAFELGPLALSYYGLFVALGIVVASWLTGRELARKGYAGGYALEALFFVVPRGLVGARLSFVAANYDQYAPNPIPAVLEVWVGGLETYGGAPAPICDPAVPQEHPLGPVNPPALWRTSTSSP
jgi:phosphatidylglycerol---prolipoprotein diacylglyceryl transferase